ncbi:MAG: class I SAM-dependent methyltransferase [Acidobacteria bacterium]|nr:class I SAM-dependent methyltransferase [Acidobacteriota bacterium]MCL5287320.1 class I SAM-dependent methyltransferase [Acidobacteriota bacterium]
MSSAAHHVTFPQRIQAWILVHACPQHEKIVAPHKRELLTGLRGTILEIGPGTGVNLAYYPQDVRWIGIEPNPLLHAHLRAALDASRIAGEFRFGSAESLDVPDASCDTVVSTLVLCTVPNLAATLREIRRVLRPGGRFVFMEHVAAPRGTLLRGVQRLIRPAWNYFGDGCHPDRETWKFIESAGFSSLQLDHFRIASPIVAPHIRGFAIK